MPTHDYGPEESAADVLRRMVEAGLNRLDNAMTDDVRNHVEQELHKIRLVHAEEYLLAVTDMKQRLEDENKDTNEDPKQCDAADSAPPLKAREHG